MLQQGNSGKLKIILIGLGLVFLVLALTGRAHALFAIIGAAMTQIMRLAPLLVRFAPFLSKHFGGVAGMTGGAGHTNSSSVSTDTLLMSLDHRNGSINGQVLVGEFQGRKLNELSNTELKTLYQYCANNDLDALRLLQTYIQRHKAEEWQASNSEGYKEDNHSSNYPDSQTMSLKEAKQVLGLDADITRKTITAAHRSLMGQFHPDKGGSDYLATKINSARDVLLRSLKE